MDEKELASDSYSLYCVVYIYTSSYFYVQNVYRADIQVLVAGRFMGKDFW
jgi:hypothetical protein